MAWVKLYKIDVAAELFEEARSTYSNRSVAHVIQIRLKSISISQQLMMPWAVMFHIGTLLSMDDYAIQSFECSIAARFLCIGDSSIFFNASSLAGVRRLSMNLDRRTPQEILKKLNDVSNKII
ncbi:hypothetical protein IFM89_022057 [Coptis chinensis]|uniref:Uncharacterized protein n=1 Tax=Coptis chinensis TaxID=261450 RepID=A0A835M3K4_9MAGN|nr:hypothetical protein IFM89_022057 [Coptis chinensis]